MSNLLHIYSQEQWHDNAYIVGDEAGLLELRAAIDEALARGESQRTAYVNDGEGYHIKVIKANEAAMECLAVPYTDKLAVERQPHRVWPHSLRSTI